MQVQKYSIEIKELLFEEKPIYKCVDVIKGYLETNIKFCHIVRKRHYRFQRAWELKRQYIVRQKILDDFNTIYENDPFINTDNLQNLDTYIERMNDKTPIETATLSKLSLVFKFCNSFTSDFQPLRDKFYVNLFSCMLYYQLIARFRKQISELKRVNINLSKDAEEKNTNRQKVLGDAIKKCRGSFKVFYNDMHIGSQRLYHELGSLISLLNLVGIQLFSTFQTIPVDKTTGCVWKDRIDTLNTKTNFKIGDIINYRLKKTT
jgi:hypothetical protein